MPAPGRGRALALTAAIVFAAGIGVAALLPVREHARAILFPMAERPRPTGAFAAGFTVVAPSGAAPGYDLWYPAVSDQPRSVGALLRLIAARIARPTRAAGWTDAAFAESGRPRPLVLFLPSWFNRRDESSFALANLASHGFVVLALDDVVHQAPFSDPEDGRAQRAGLDPASPSAYARSRALAARRVRLSAERASLAVASLVRSPAWASRVDPDELGIVGFSFGGSVAGDLAAADPRVKAAIDLDGDLLVDRDPRGPSGPVLVLTSDIPFPDDGDVTQPDPARRLDAILTQKTFRHWATNPHAEAFVVRGATHVDFCDRLVMPPFADAFKRDRIDRSGIWADINGAIVAFLAAHLGKGTAAAPSPMPRSFHRLIVPASTSGDGPGTHD